MKRATFIALACAVLPATVSAQDTAPLQGRFFRLRHDLDKATAKQALKILDAAWKQADKLFKASKPKKALFPVHLYGSYKDFDSIASKRKRKPTGRWLSFTDWDEGDAHVAIQPPMKTRTLEVIGLPLQTRLALAREAADLALWSSYPQRQHFPAWLTEGVRSYVAIQVALQKKWLLGGTLSNDPYHGTQITQSRRPRADSSSILMDHLHGVTSEDLAAIHMCFFLRLCGEKATKMRLFMRRTLKGLEHTPDFAYDIKQEVAKRFGDLKNWRHPAKLSFYSSWLEKEPALELRKGKWIQVAHRFAAACFTRRQAEQFPYTIEGKLQFLPAKNPSMAVLVHANKGVQHFRFDIHQNGQLDINLVARPNSIGLRRRNHKKIQPTRTRITSKKIPALRILTDHAFKLVVSRTRISLSLPGHNNVTIDTEPQPSPSKTWGVGVGPGAAGIWKEMQVK